MRRLSFICIAALVLGLVSVADAGSRYGKRIGVETASGDYATAVASGTARRPGAIYVVVKSSPRQGISDGAWSVTCSRGLGAGSRSGEFGGSTPRAVRIRLPMRRPTTCYVGASAQLDEGGDLRVSIYGKPR
jgi:hypothetical protein